MAFATDIHGGNVDITGRVSAVLKSAKLRFDNYRAYRKTISELSALSTRDLDDMGIYRSMIKRIALETVYDL